MNPRTQKGRGSQGCWSRLMNCNWLVLAPFTFASLIFASLTAPAQAQPSSLIVPTNPSQTGVFQSPVVDSVPYPTPQIIEIKNPNRPQQRTYVIAPQGQNVGGEINTAQRSTPWIQIVQVDSGFLNQRIANIVNFSF